MKNKYKILLSALIATTTAFSVQAQDIDTYKAQALLDAKALSTNTVVINAIKTQNESHAALSAEKILELDVMWRTEVKNDNFTIVNTVKDSKASAELVGIKDASQGTYGEVFVMDNKGLNVAMSDITSDYWQGDEGKWSETFSKGAGAVHVSEVEFDESAQAYTTQISTSITDETGAVIGAVTFGVIME
jgi:hypothetical protein